ncbi:MAG: hypothetical protein RL336_1229 [Pseudomonadota bacterium]
MNLKTKMLLGIGVLVTLPLALQALIITWQANNGASQALADTNNRQLIAIRDGKKSQIEDYFSLIRNQVITYADDPMVQAAMLAFSEGFQSLEMDQAIDPQRIEASLTQYYEKEFNATYRASNGDKSVNTTALLKQLSSTAKLAQFLYISNNPEPLGNKHQMHDSAFKSRYNNTHKNLHKNFKLILEAFGFYDIFLVDSSNDSVVYSVFKELDFATSLSSGPYANTGIAEAYKRARQLPPRRATLSDFQRYVPSYNSPASFIASPIYRSDKLIGVLIFQMPTGKINEVMTSHEKWREVGLGESGETYLVGSDHKARSISRFLVEDPSGYHKTLIQQGTDTALAKEITTKGSNIGLQSIDTKAVQLALNGQSGVQSIQDYRSVNVLSAYTPLEIEDLNWVLLSEIDEEEAFSATGELQWNIIITSLVSVAVFTVLGLILSGWFANSISRPIESLAATMRHIATNHDLTLRSEIARTDEIGDMANSVNTMLVGFQTLVQRILAATVNVAAATEQLSSVSATTQDGINTQRSETEQVATAMHEMVATVAEIARNTAEAASAAEETDQQAQAGKASIERTARTLSELNDAMHSSSNVIEQLHQDSDKIGQVLEVISAIAEQTNLLALNAAIEAARAGEQGRGFAVVADEVRTLAARTQNSTEEINQIIAGLQSRAKQAVESMQHSRSKTSDTIDQAEETRSTLEQITVAVNQITEMSLQIASAAEEQNSVAEEINRNIVAISEVSELSVHGSEQTATASQELARLGADLHHLASEFKA